MLDVIRNFNTILKTFNRKIKRIKITVKAEAMYKICPKCHSSASIHCIFLRTSDDVRRSKRPFPKDRSEKCICLQKDGEHFLKLHLYNVLMACLRDTQKRCVGPMVRSSKKYSGSVKDLQILLSSRIFTIHNICYFVLQK